MTTAKTFTDLPEGIHVITIFLPNKTDRYFLEVSMSEGYSTYMMYNHKVEGAFFTIIQETISISFYARAITHEYRTFDFVKFSNILITQLPQIQKP